MQRTNDDSDSERNWELGDRIERDGQREQSFLQRDFRRRMDGETGRERPYLIGGEAKGGKAALAEAVMAFATSGGAL